jgi:hypothetical protein
MPLCMPSWCVQENLYITHQRKQEIEFVDPELKSCSKLPHVCHWKCKETE